MTLSLPRMSPRALFVALSWAMLAGCASTELAAPVESRTPAAPVRAGAEEAVTTPAAPALPRPGYHIVKRGETLYSISLENGQDYREVARWNAIDNPNLIQVGQELRVLPPETGASVTPVQMPSISVVASTPSASAPQVVPPATGATSAPLVANSPTVVKTEPKGGRVPYSPTILADLQKGAPVTAVSAPQPAPTKPVAPVVSSAPVAAPASQSAPVATSAASAPVAETKSGDEAIDWLWPTNGKVIATFNDASNKGVDLAGNVGDPVLATAAGKVIYVGSDLRGYGNLVIIKHNNSYLSAYAHNSEVLVKEGLQVARGQKIAAVGQSDADRPKLHFEIRRQGKPVDPLKYLPKR